LKISAKNTQQQLINEQIRVPQVRLIDMDGSQCGIVNTRDALLKAYDKGLDLVLMAGSSAPPVCRIMDFGKYRFEREKKEKEMRKRQVIIELKEIKFSCRIDTHDFNTKIGHAHRFLKEGNKVKVTIVFSGREMNHTNIGYELMNKIASTCDEQATVEKRPSLDGRYMTMILAPMQNKQ